MRKIITTCMQFVSLCWMAAIAEGKLTRSLIPGESPKLQLFPWAYLDESKVYRNSKWKFHLQHPKLISSTNNQTLIKKRSSSIETNDDVLMNRVSSADGTLAISENASAFLKTEEFHVSSDMVGGGGGLQLFGVTNSFVNPGALLSTTIENGLKQLSEAANSLSNKTSLVVQQSPPNTTNGGSPAQFFGIANSESKHDSQLTEKYPSVTNGTLAQFFGIANIYVGGLNQSTANSQSQCPICPQAVSVGCPAPPEAPAPQIINVGCPSPPEHAVLTVTVTACETLSSLGTCSVASIAQSGTIFVSYPFGISSRRRKFLHYFKKKKKKKSQMATIGSAVIGIMATPPNTKVSVTCPNIPAGITVTTQNGPVLPYKPREETGFIQLLVSGTASPANVAVACVWTSTP